MDQQNDNFTKMRVGLAAAFETKGHPCYLYDMGSKAPLDAFYDLKPDLYVGSYALHTTAVRKGLEKYQCSFFALDAIKPAFDSIGFKRGKPVSSLGCSIAYIGLPREDLINLLRGIEDSHNFKLFGPKPWGVPQYLGNPISNESIANIYSNATLSPAFTLEEYYTVIGCGGFAHKIENTDVLALLDDVSDGTLDKFKEELYEWVLKYNTYLNRIDSIMARLASPAEGGEKHSVN